MPLSEVAFNVKVPKALGEPAASSVIGYLDMIAVLTIMCCAPKEETYPPSITIVGLPLSVPATLYSVLEYEVFTLFYVVVPVIACPIHNCHCTVWFPSLYTSTSMKATLFLFVMPLNVALGLRLSI